MEGGNGDMMNGDVEVKSRSCCGMESSVSLGFTLGCMCSPTNDVDVYKRRVEMVGDRMWDSSQCHHTRRIPSCR